MTTITLQPGVQHGHKKHEEDSNFLRQGALRYWGYVNEAAEAFAPQIKKTVGSNFMGKDVVHWWSYRVVDAYAWLDGLFSGARAFRDSKGRPNKERVFNALEEGGNAVLFQQFASVYVPATVVSGVRKGAEAALQGKQHHGVKTGLDKVLNVVEAPVMNGTQALVSAGKHTPGLKNVLSHPAAKTWFPALMAVSVIPAVIKPIDHLANLFTNVTYRPVTRLLRSVLLPGTQPVDELRHQKHSLLGGLMAGKLQDRQPVTPHPAFQTFNI
jgi:hypothetical protein